MPHISMCKQWHKRSNQFLTCVTLKIKIFWPIKRCHVSWRKSLKNPLIRLWHASPIRLRHVSLTFPQTPKNRSLPKTAFLHTRTSWERSWKTPMHQCHKQHQRRFKSTEGLLESSPEASRNFKNFNIWIRRTFETESSKLPA